MLSWHVDYWDHLGWKDPFGDKAWTRRQRRYARALQSRTVYTPMMVFNGRLHTPRKTDIKKVYDQLSAREPQVKLEAALKLAGDRLLVKARSRALEGVKLSKNTQVLVAIAEDGLVTKPNKGENNGRKLRESSVVRKLLDGKPIGGEASWSLRLKDDWKRENLRVVVFVQHPGSMLVYEARELSVNDSKPKG